MGWFSPVDADPRLIIMAGGLIIVDRSCDAFDTHDVPVWLGHSLWFACATGVKQPDWGSEKLPFGEESTHDP